MVPEHGDAPRSRDYKALVLLLNYTGKWPLRIDLHNRHRRFQHRALLSELQRENDIIGDSGQIRTDDRRVAAASLNYLGTLPSKVRKKHQDKHT